MEEIRNVFNDKTDPNQQNNGYPVRSKWSYIYNNPPAPILSTVDFINQIPLIHNNIPNNVLRSKIKEFTMILDSTDRDVVLYPNPFEYRVSIGPQVQQRIINYVRNSSGDAIMDPITRNPVTQESVISTPGPVVKDKVVWIKYIRVDHAILPRAYTMNLKSLENNVLDHTSIFHNVGMNVLDEDRCVQVHISEIEGKLNNQIGPCHYSTNDSLTNSAAILFDNIPINKKFYFSTNKGSGTEYDESLRELHTLTISFKDSCGMQLRYPFLSSCKCCNTNSCKSICCKQNILETITYGGLLCVDLLPILQSWFDLNININLTTNDISGSGFNLKYKLEKMNDTYNILINGIFLENRLDLHGTLKKTNNILHCEFGGKYDIVDIKGKLDFIVSENNISGIVKFTAGIEKFIISFSLPIHSTQTHISINHVILVHQYPMSIIEPIVLNIPVIDVGIDVIRYHGTIGNNTIHGSFNKKSRSVKLELLGMLFNKHCNIAVDVKNGFGSIVGKYGSENISLVVNWNAQTLIIFGQIGNNPINLVYNSSIGPLTDFTKIYGMIQDVTLQTNIPFCINIDKIESSLGIHIDTSISLPGVTISNEMVAISDSQYIGSYSINNDRGPMNINCCTGVIFGDYVNIKNDTILIINKIENEFLGKIAGLFNYTIRSVDATQLDITDTNTTYNLTGTIQKDFVSVLNPNSDMCIGIIHTDNAVQKKCCNCKISPKDIRLQNQLHIKLGLVHDDIPLLFNKQS
jgi:hypothetical protein